ncbi:hypothetical protein E2C01_025216 [Portunus trituberculatus]|uniref:Uncharacterized protein n=1 Tax=Portunus trituberculatus TaxID=210409 RepID=A0A5B7EEZ9_PORTR|nr:hypothetical protein [Portunus trituberculatus]
MWPSGLSKHQQLIPSLRNTHSFPAGSHLDLIDTPPWWLVLCLWGRREDHDGGGRDCGWAVLRYCARLAPKSAYSTIATK